MNKLHKKWLFLITYEKLYCSKISHSKINKMFMSRQTIMQFEPAIFEKSFLIKKTYKSIMERLHKKWPFLINCGKWIVKKIFMVRLEKCLFTKKMKQFEPYILEKLYKHINKWPHSQLLPPYTNTQTDIYIHTETYR